MSKTVQVRIAVAVDPEGKWAAAGYHGMRNAEEITKILDVSGVGRSSAIHWVVAELPIPESMTVAGAVTTADACRAALSEGGENG